MCDDSWKIWNVKHVRNSPNTKPVKTGKMKQFRETTPSFGLTIPGIQGRGVFLKFRILAGFLSELLRAAARSTAAVAAAAAVTRSPIRCVLFILGFRFAFQVNLKPE